MSHVVRAGQGQISLSLCCQSASQKAPNNRLLALGCGSHVEVVLLNAASSRISQQCLLQWGGKGQSGSGSSSSSSSGAGGTSSVVTSTSSSSSQRFTVTDVRFSPHISDAFLVAAATTNGALTVFELASSSSAQSKLRWESGESTTSVQTRVNRIAWHPSIMHLLASGNMDGSVRLYDIRAPGGAGHHQQQPDIFKDRTSAISAMRDVQFDPFDPTKFASLCDGGILSIWDMRYGGASGGGNDVGDGSGLANMLTPPLIPFGGGGGGGGGALPSSPSPNKIQLGTPTHSHHPPLPFLLSPQSSTSSGGPISKFSAHINGGLVLAYNESRANVIATGSRDKMVKVWDFSTVLGGAPRPSHVLHTPSAVGRIYWRGQAAGDQLATTSSSDSGEISVWKLSAEGASFFDPVCVLSGHTETCTDFQWLSTLDDSGRVIALQHIVSVGKDGRMLVQDLRKAYFPNQHVARCVTTISSHGHVAFHRGFIDRSDPVGLVSTPLAPGWFSHDDKLRNGLQGGSFEVEESALCLSSPAVDDTLEQQSERKEEEWLKVEKRKETFVTSRGRFETGVVFCGLADISDLQDARGIRAQRGAEGGVFDPAVISLLARSYVLSADFSELSDVSRGILRARSACEYNLKVAAKAGLASRAAIWTAVLALLPVSPPTAGQKKSMPDVGCLVGGEQQVDVAFCDKLPERVPFGNELLGKILLELLEGGDTQHFVLLCEVLRRADGLDETALQASSISDMRRREAYLAYFDLLSRLQLFCAANNIIKASDEEYISKLSRQGVTIHTMCAKCGKETPEEGTHPWCSKCRRCASLCALCHKPIKGLMHWCPVCGHGGHLACTQLWFKTKGNAECPSGCGHHCCNGTN